MYISLCSWLVSYRLAKEWLRLFHYGAVVNYCLPKVCGK